VSDDLDQLLHENLGTIFNIGVALGRIERRTFGCLFCQAEKNTRQVELVIDNVDRQWRRPANVCPLHDPLTRGAFNADIAAFGPFYKFTFRIQGEPGPVPEEMPATNDLAKELPDALDLKSGDLVGEHLRQVQEAGETVWSLYATRKFRDLLAQPGTPKLGADAELWFLNFLKTCDGV
jgi:hypothetical protein